MKNTLKIITIFFLLINISFAETQIEDNESGTVFESNDNTPVKKLKIVKKQKTIVLPSEYIGDDEARNNELMGKMYEKLDDEARKYLNFEEHQERPQLIELHKKQKVKKVEFKNENGLEFQVKDFNLIFIYFAIAGCSTFLIAFSRYIYVFCRKKRLKK
jgi:hypothetical protein